MAVRKGRYWCGHFCPRGSLYDQVISRFSPHKPIPKFVRSKGFRIFMLCFIFAMLVTTGAVVLFQQASFIIGGERTSILSTLEPTTSVIVGILIFHEPLSLRTVLGSVLVILASLLIAVFDIKSQK